MRPSGGLVGKACTSKNTKVVICRLAKIESGSRCVIVEETGRQNIVKINRCMNGLNPICGGYGSMSQYGKHNFVDSADHSFCFTILL